MPAITVATQRLSLAIPGREKLAPQQSPYLIGVLTGEGIGPEVIQASLKVLDAIQTTTDYRFILLQGGEIGTQAQRRTGHALTEEVIDFCSTVFEDNGAIFCGPGGGRFVYELRAHFDLFCKLVPLRPVRAIREVGVLKPEATDNVDILVIRENIGGLYLGEFGFDENDGKRRAFHTFHYDNVQVARILQVAVNAARMRRGRLCVITKPGGAPSISRLWQEQAEALMADGDIELRLLEIDTASYQLLAEADNFDVVVAPNMFGDVLADGATLLLGSRGMSYSANFAATGAAVYQTGHGAAYDLAGTDRANPIGQIQSLAMMLCESFGLDELSRHIQAAISDTLAAGWRSRDILAPGCRAVGTQELGNLIAETLRARLDSPQLLAPA